METPDPPYFARLGNACGLLAPVLWAAAIVYCGSLRPDFSHIHQYISELGERTSSTEYLMRYLGFVPTGLMHVAFAAFLYAKFRGQKFAAWAAVLLAVNGLARAAAGLFPCEVGCAASELLAPRIHSLAATTGFFALIGAAVLWGAICRRDLGLRSLGAYAYFTAAAALVFLLLMSASETTRAGTGLYERASSGVLSLWVFVFAARLWWLRVVAAAS